MNDLITQEKPQAPVQITEDIQVSLNRLGRELETHAESGIRIGKELLHLKDITPHGKFLELAEWSHGLKRTTCENYMNIAEKYGQNPNQLGFSTTVLVELSRPSVPESAREEAQLHENLTVRQSKEIVAANKRIAELQAECEQLKTPPIPNINNLIPELNKLYRSGSIVIARANDLSILPRDKQEIYLSEFHSKEFYRKEAERANAAAQSSLEKAIKAIEDKESVIAQLKAVSGSGNADLIAQYEEEKRLLKEENLRIKEENRRRAFQERKDIENQAKELYARVNKEKIEKAEKEKALAEKKKQEAEAKASAAWRKNDELTRENKKLQSQLEVDKPENIDNARALKLGRELKSLSFIFADIRLDNKFAKGEMHETKKIILEIIKTWSEFLEDLENNNTVDDLDKSFAIDINN